MTRWGAWLTGVALLVAAWFVAWATPDGEERMTDTFPVAAHLGTPVEARNLGLTIHDLTLADRVSSGGWFADGTWLVVELDAWVVSSEVGNSLGNAFLTVGDRTFSASERPGTYSPSASLYRTALRLGLPQSGSLAFELPADVLADAGAGSAVMRLAPGVFLPGLSTDQNLAGEASVELPVDLTSLSHVEELPLPATEWTAP